MAYPGFAWLPANALAGFQAVIEEDQIDQQAAVVSLEIGELEQVISWARRLEEIAIKRIKERKAEAKR